MAGFGSTTFDASALDTVAGVDGVAAASAALSLTNTTFSGELPQLRGTAPTEGTPPPRATRPAAAGRRVRRRGGSAFDVNSFTVLGIDPAARRSGRCRPSSSTDGRGLEASDAGQAVAVLDASYATSAELAVGDTIDVGGTEIEIVGIVASTSADAETAANVYIPLDVAQSLAGLDGQVSDLYVQATSSDQIAAVQADIEEALPDATVWTQADLAASVSGSLSTASSLISNLGIWLSVAVLARRSCSRSSSRSRASPAAPASSARSRRSAGRTAASSARSRASRSCRASSAAPPASCSASPASG